jgi:ribosomal protein S4E
MGWKAAQKVFKQWKILRGDKVMVMAGKDVGLTGTIQKVIRSQNRVIVEGRNLVRRVFGIGIEIQVGELSKHMRSSLLGQNLSIEPPRT